MEIIKDVWDYVSICSNVLYSFLSLILIFICSALVSDRIKRNKQEQDHLNYLAICLNRYLEHIISFWRIAEERIKHLQSFIDDPSDSVKLFQAFQIIKTPIPNFEILLPDYAFTLKNDPQILNLLLIYIEKYSEIISSIAYFNHEIDLVLQPDVPIDKKISLAKDSLKENFEESNLFRWRFSICMTIYALYKLLNDVHNYLKKYKYKQAIQLYISDKQLNIVNASEKFIDKHCPDPNWRNVFVLPQFTSNNKKTNWFNFFKKKQNIEDVKLNTINNINTIQVGVFDLMYNILPQLNEAIQNIGIKLENIYNEIKKKEDN